MQSTKKFGRSSSSYDSRKDITKLISRDPPQKLRPQKWRFRTRNTSDGTRTAPKSSPWNYNIY